MVFDYNLLDNIQISDDEDETHPNIDTHSLFRMRHRHRLEKKEEMEMQKQDLEFKIQKHRNTIDAGGLDESEFRKISAELDEFTSQFDQLLEREKKQGLDIDNFVTKQTDSKSVFSKETEEEKQMAELLEANKPKSNSEEHLIKAAQNLEISNEKDEDLNVELKKMEINKNYALKHKKTILEFFKIKNPKKLKEFIFDHHELLHQGVLTWSLIKMVDYQYEEKTTHVNHMVYPIVHLKFLIELISTVGGDKQKIVTNYFAKFIQNESSLIDSFDDEKQRLLENAKNLADERHKQLIKEDMEERRKHLNGLEPLDPNDVINQLPEKMVQCFVKRDIGMLQQVIAEMDPKDAEKYMSLCIRSGLWNPGPNHDDQDNDENDAESDKKSEGSTVYEESPVIGVEAGEKS